MIFLFLVPSQEITVQFSLTNNFNLLMPSKNVRAAKICKSDIFFPLSRKANIFLSKIKIIAWSSDETACVWTKWLHQYLNTIKQRRAMRIRNWIAQVIPIEVFQRVAITGLELREMDAWSRPFLDYINLFLTKSSV